MSELAFPIQVKLQEHSDFFQQTYDLRTIELNIEPVIAQTDMEFRVDFLSDIMNGKYDGLEWIFNKAQELGLTPKHEGPFIVLPLIFHEWIADPANLDKVLGVPVGIPIKDSQIIIKNQILQNPVSVEQALKDADENGFVTTLLKVPFNAYLGAYASNSSDWDEHDLFAQKVSKLPPYDSNYEVLSMEGDRGDKYLIVEFSTNVVAANRNL